MSKQPSLCSPVNLRQNACFKICILKFATDSQLNLKNNLAKEKCYPTVFNKNSQFYNMDRAGDMFWLVRHLFYSHPMY